MAPIPKDPERENRIHMDIIADANGSDEQVMGWYYYLDDVIDFPFTATCTLKQSTSPLKVGDTVKILGMAAMDDCEREMFVESEWQGGTLAIPLAQITPLDDTDDQTKQAVADWHYWVNRGYKF
jgi:hypothetical protein